MDLSNLQEKLSEQADSLIEVALSLPQGYAIAFAVFSATVATYVPMRMHEVRGLGKILVWLVILLVGFYALIGALQLSPVLVDPEDLARSQSIRQ